MKDEITVRRQWRARWFWRAPWRASWPVFGGHFLASVDGWHRPSVVRKAERLRDAHRRMERADIDPVSFGSRW